MGDPLKDPTAGIYRAVVERRDRVRIVLPVKLGPWLDGGDGLTDAEFLELCAIEDPSRNVARRQEIPSQRSI